MAGAQGLGLDEGGAPDGKHGRKRPQSLRAPVVGVLPLAHEGRVAGEKPLGLGQRTRVRKGRGK